MYNIVLYGHNNKYDIHNSIDSYIHLGYNYYYDSIQWMESIMMYLVLVNDMLLSFGSMISHTWYVKIFRITVCADDDDVPIKLIFPSAVL